MMLLISLDLDFGCTRYNQGWVNGPTEIPLSDLSWIYHI